MSCYALVQLFVERRRRFAQGFLLVVGAVFVFAMLQPLSYRTELTLSVTRTALPVTTEYAYDSYYRFQADKELADTLVQYLGSATGKQHIAELAGLSSSEYARFTEEELRIARRGANLIAIEYDTPDRALATRLGEALDQTANTYVATLNEDAREPAWFTVIASEPVSREYLLTPVRLVAIALIGGLLAGFWAVLLQYFWEGYRDYARSKSKNQ